MKFNRGMDTVDTDKEASVGVHALVQAADKLKLELQRRLRTTKDHCQPPFSERGSVSRSSVLMQASST